MKISIITVVYNGEQYIEQAMQSVLGQVLPSDWKLEYIVIDGKSTDGTVKIIEKHMSELAYFVSEKDGGIYNAMNKGIAKATGDIVGVLNADDFYIDAYVLQKVLKEFGSDKEIDAVYADLEYVASQDTTKVVRYWESQKYVKGLFKKGWHPAHPTLFVKGHVYKKCGVFNEQFKIAADYDFMLRIFEKFHIKSTYLPEVLVHMRTGGASGGNWMSVWQANKESFQSLRSQGHSPFVSILAIVRKPLSKCKQLFKRSKAQNKYT